MAYHETVHGDLICVWTFVVVSGSEFSEQKTLSGEDFEVLTPPILVSDRTRPARVSRAMTVKMGEGGVNEGTMPQQTHEQRRCALF